MSFKSFARFVAFHSLGRANFLKLKMRLNLGYWPNIRNPKTFNEHLAHRMLVDNPPDAPLLADKHAVRAFVAATVGEEYLTPLLFVGSNPEAIPWDTLPTSFVIKCTHDSGTTHIITDKAKASRPALQEAIAKALATRQTGRYTNEPWYLAVPPRFVIEELMQDKTHGIPLDFKFFVFNGRVEYIQVDHSRFTAHTRSFYSRDWVEQEFTVTYPRAPTTPKPAGLAEMCGIAERLAQNYPFVRVDLYLIDNTTIRFGEITFAPGAALERFSPESYDGRLGQLWKSRSSLD